MKISVVGLGYMGLPTSCLFATSGHKVIGVDINEQRVNDVNNNKCPFSEKGLSELLDKAIKSGNLTASTKLETSDVYIIAVPTPKEGDKANLNYVISAAESIAEVIKEGDLVILESTVPPKTTKNVLKPIFDAKVKNYLLSHCPERAIPGNTLHELINNDRVIGGFDNESSNITRKLYESFVKGNIFVTNATTAEACKLMENTYRDVNIALANELAKISSDLEINVWEAIKLANKHPRVNIHSPGPGVGGHCIAVDPWFLTESTDNAQLISLSRQINDSMPEHVVNLIEQTVEKESDIAILGVAYKKNVDDPRETPALEIIKLLHAKNYKVKITDPFVENFKHDLHKFEDAIHNVDCVVIITDHSEYSEIHPEEFSAMKHKKIIDTRNCLDKELFKKHGFHVITLGDYYFN